MRLLSIVILSLAALVIIPSYASTTVITDTSITASQINITPTSPSANLATYKNSSGNIVGTITAQGVWTGYINNPIGADYTISINGSGFFIEYNGKTNQILMSSQNKTSASEVIQDAWNRVNATSATGKGGQVDVDCGTYPIQHSLNIPANGNLTFTGHGRGCTILQVPTAFNNVNAMQFTGAHTVTSFRNNFAHFFLVSQSSAGKNTGIFCNGNGTSGNGLTDSIFTDLDIENFGKDDVYLGPDCQWNNVFDKVIFEKAGRAELYSTSSNSFGQDLRVTDSKMILNNGKAALILNGTVAAQIINNYFSLNQYSDIYIDNGTKYTMIMDNQFQTCSVAGVSKTDCIGIAYAQGDQINSNFFNSANPNYDINFYGNGTSSTNSMQIHDNFIYTQPTQKQFVNYASASKSYGPLKVNDVSNNFYGQLNLSTNAPNCFNAVTDPSKNVCFYGMGNFARLHTFNQTIPTTNGTIINLINATSDPTSSNLPAGNCAFWTYTNHNSTYKLFCTSGTTPKHVTLS